MKKRLFGVMLAAVAAMSASAFAGEVTVEDIMAKYTEAGAQLTEASAVETMDADIALSHEGESIMALTGHADMDVKFSKEPFQAEVAASMTGSMNSMGEEQGGSINMDVYVVPDEDGVLVTYAGLDQGTGIEWMKSSVGEEATQQITTLLANAANYNVELPTDMWTLADGTVDVNGADCYELTATLTMEDILNLYTQVMEKFSDQLPKEVTSQIPDAETLQMVGAMLGGLQFNVTLDIDSASYLPARVYLDTEGSDWVTLGAVVGSLMMNSESEDGEIPNIGLDVNSLYLECVYDYSEPVEVVVPDEVIESAQDLGSAEEMAELGDVLETLESESELF